MERTFGTSMSQIDFSGVGCFPGIPCGCWWCRTVHIHVLRCCHRILHRINLHLGCCDLRISKWNILLFCGNTKARNCSQSCLLENACVRYDCRAGDVYPLASSSEKGSSIPCSDFDNPTPLFLFTNKMCKYIKSA